VYDIIVIENPEKKRKFGDKIKFLDEFPSKTGSGVDFIA